MESVLKAKIDLVQFKLNRIKNLTRTPNSPIAQLQINSPLELPPEWTKQTNTCALVSVNRFSTEWTKIETRVSSTMPRVLIHKILRVQNIWLWNRYYRECMAIKTKNAGKLNEHLLFHGTRNTDPVEIYNGEYGFDMRFSRKGLWGRALYFAEDAEYSNAYAYSLGNKKHFFLAKVVS